MKSETIFSVTWIASDFSHLTLQLENNTEAINCIACVLLIWIRTDSNSRVFCVFSMSKSIQYSLCARVESSLLRHTVDLLQGNA